jgi:hypothetical protein
MSVRTGAGGGGVVADRLAPETGADAGWTRVEGEGMSRSCLPATSKMRGGLFSIVMQPVGPHARIKASAVAFRITSPLKPSGESRRRIVAD